MNTGLRTVVVPLLVAAAIFATVGEGDTEKSSESKSESVASSQAAPIPVGTDVTVADGWNVKVNSAELNANATIAAANEFNTPAPGTQYVSVNVSITNKSDQPEAPFTNVKLSLLPSTGVAISNAFVAGLPDGFESTAQMQPNATATGVIVFEVPTAEVDKSVLLAQSVFTLDAKKDQKFLAIK